METTTTPEPTQECALFCFDGLYESASSQLLDDALEQLLQDSSGNPIKDRPLPEEEEEKEQPALFDPANWEDGVSGVEDISWKHVEWRKAHLAYVPVYVDVLREQVKHSLGLDLEIKFKATDSPKEYNFTTDRLFVDIPTRIVERLFAEVDKERLDKTIKQEFTSYDGFISHYPNSLAAWLPSDQDEEERARNRYFSRPEGLPVEEWDHNQVGTLLEAWMTGHADWDEDDFKVWRMMESDMGNGTFDTIMYDALDAEGRRIVDACSAYREKQDEAFHARWAAQRAASLGTAEGRTNE